MSPTKKITLTSIGIALFVVLTMMFQVPVFENYYICLGYLVMAVYCYSFGVISGTFVGIFGTILYCLIINGLRGMPGWVLGNIVICIIAGFTFRYTKNMRNKFLKYTICIISIVFSTFLGILVAKSGLESIIYAQPFFIRTASNIYAFVADVVILIFSIPFCEILDKRIKKGVYSNANDS